MNVHKLTLLAMLTASAIVIAIAESFIPSIFIPGIKLGLTNIVILITLYELGIMEATFINLTRIAIVGLVRGTFLSMGFLMSLTGGILSLGIMIIFYLLIKKFSVIGVSVIGAIFHVAGQILIAMIYLDTVYILYYLPFIAIAAIITGTFVGIIAQLVIKTGIIKKQREKYNF